MTVARRSAGAAETRAALVIDTKAAAADIVGASGTIGAVGEAEARAEDMGLAGTHVREALLWVAVGPDSARLWEGALGPICGALSGTREMDVRVQGATGRGRRVLKEETVDRAIATAGTIVILDMKDSARARRRIGDPATEEATRGVGAANVGIAGASGPRVRKGTGGEAEATEERGPTGMIGTVRDGAVIVKTVISVMMRSVGQGVEPVPSRTSVPSIYRKP